MVMQKGGFEFEFKLKKMGVAGKERRWPAMIFISSYKVNTKQK
jgi:hypothetical protein